MLDARDFDRAEPLERAIAGLLADEGLVLWSHLAAGGQVHLVAVLAGEDGPEIACAAAWTSRPGEVIARERLRIPVETACRKHLPASAVESLADHLPDDTALRSAAGGGVRALWRDSDGTQTVYLVRMPGEAGREIGIAVAERREDGSWSASLRWSCPAESFREWAEAEIGGPVPPVRRA